MTGGLAVVVEVEVLAPLWFVACLSSPSPEPSSLQRARTGGFINEGMLFHIYHSCHELMIDRLLFWRSLR
jgi:hypothetical protein